MKKPKHPIPNFCQQLDDVKDLFGTLTEQPKKKDSPMKEDDSVDNFLKGFGRSQGDE